MKNIFLSLIALAGLASIAGAAVPETETPNYVLPTYVVTATRQSPAEQRISERLTAFREEARRHAIAVPGATPPKAQPTIAGAIPPARPSIGTKA